MEGPGFEQVGGWAGGRVGRRVFTVHSQAIARARLVVTNRLRMGAPLRCCSSLGTGSNYSVTVVLRAISFSPLPTLTHALLSLTLPLFLPPSLTLSLFVLTDARPAHVCTCRMLSTMHLFMPSDCPSHLPATYPTVFFSPLLLPLTMTVEAITLVG